MSNQKAPEATIKRFGKEYCFQGTFADQAALDKCRNIWKSIGHLTLLLDKKHLYATRFKTRK